MVLITSIQIPYDTHSSAKPNCKGGQDIWSSWVPRKQGKWIWKKSLAVFATLLQSTKVNKPNPCHPSIHHFIKKEKNNGRTVSLNQGKSYKLKKNSLNKNLFHESYFFLILLLSCVHLLRVGSCVCQHLKTSAIHCVYSRLCIIPRVPHAVFCLYPLFVFLECHS